MTHDVERLSISDEFEDEGYSSGSGSESPGEQDGEEEGNFEEMDWYHSSSSEESEMDFEEQWQRSGAQGVHEAHQGSRVEAQDSNVVQQTGTYHKQGGDCIEEDNPQSQAVGYTLGLAEDGGLTENDMLILESISNIEGCGVICEFLPALDLSIDGGCLVLQNKREIRIG